MNNLKTALLTALVTFMTVTTPAAAAEWSTWKLAGSAEKFNTALDAVFGKIGTTPTSYPVGIQCGLSGGKPVVRFAVERLGGSKPFHKWNATMLRSGETQQAAAARLRVKDEPQWQYQVKFACTAAGRTYIVAFRGPADQLAGF